MTTANPYLKLTMSGYKTVKDIEYIHEYSTIASSFNKVFHDIIDTDGDVSIPITKLGTLLAIQINSSDNATLKITDGVGTQTLQASGYLLYEFDSTYAATITAITIATTSTTAVDVEVTIYGS